MWLESNIAWIFEHECSRDKDYGEECDFVLAIFVKHPWYKFHDQDLRMVVLVVGIESFTKHGCIGQDLPLCCKVLVNEEMMRLIFNGAIRSILKL